MAEFDVAIVGTSLLSGLLAGILARDYGRKLVRIGRQRSAQRLPRSVDLALPLATRPETWGMLRRAAAETRTLLGSMGTPEAATSSEVELLADLPQSTAALDHLAHMALGHGHQLRRTPGGWALRRVAGIDAGAVERRLRDWLTAAGVSLVDNGPVDAATTVLADDDAVFDYLAETDRPALLVPQSMTSTLLVCRPQSASIRHFVDRGVTLLARSGGTTLAVARGELEVEARIASTLPGPFPVKRLATTRFRRFASVDGAPVVGKVGKAFVVAGLGDATPFFAPALARFIAGASEPEEKRWFATHAPGKDRTAIADFVSAAEASA